MILGRKDVSKVNISNWEASMWSAVRTATKENRFDVLNLYLKLERVSKKYLKTGEMKEGDFFKIPLETGTMLKVNFYENYSTVDAILPDGRVDVAVSKKDYFEEEYKYLRALSNTLCPDKNSVETDEYFGIGAKASKEFCEIMSKAQVGDVFVFDGGKAFVCESAFDVYKTFVRTSTNIKTPHISEMKFSEKFSVNTRMPSSVQQAFRQVKDPYTCDIKMSITTIDAAKEVLKDLVGDLKTTNELTLGPNKIVVQKDKATGEPAYFNKSGERLTEQQVVLTLAWLEVNPNRVEIYRHSPSNSVQKFDNAIITRLVDELMAQKRYTDALSVIKDAVNMGAKVLEIDLSSYVKNNGEYEAVSYLFKKEEDGQISITEVRYNDNNFDAGIASVNKVSEDTVISYCEKKYDEKFKYVKSLVIEEALERFPEWKGEMFDKAINSLTSKTLLTQRAFGVNIDAADANMAALTEISFDEKEEI